MHRISRFPMIAGFAALAAAQASAAPILIDFTDSSRWSGVNGAASHTQVYNGLGVELSASSGRMTFNSGEAPSATSPLNFDGDGIGIGDDEISWEQSLNVSFSSDVTILGYAFLDLFNGEGPEGEAEMALVDIASGAGNIEQLNYGTATDAIGWFERDLGAEAIAGVTSMTFSVGAFQHRSLSGFSDFALAGIWIDMDPVSVPEPGPLALLGMGLAGLLLRRRLAK